MGIMNAVGMVLGLVGSGTIPKVESEEPQAFDPFTDRARGSIWLGALGDALGYVVEFESIERILEQHGKAGFTVEGLAARSTTYQDIAVSDDTQMTLFTAEGMLRGLGTGEDGIVEQVRLAYLDWHLTQQGGKAASRAIGDLARKASLNVRRAPGNTCLEACRSGANGTPKAPLNDSMGCGGVMRAAPLAFIPNLDDEGAWRLGTKTGALTHGHQMGYMPAGALVWLIRRLAHGQELPEASIALVEMLQIIPEAKPLTDALQNAMHMARNRMTGPSVIETLGGGWVGHEALAIALFCALRHATPISCIEMAANHSGDSDSTAAVAGNILGAWLGFKGITAVDPLIEDIFRNLDVARELTDIVGRIESAVTPAHSSGRA